MAPAGDPWLQLHRPARCPAARRSDRRLRPGPASNRRRSLRPVRSAPEVASLRSRRGRSPRRGFAARVALRGQALPRLRGAGAAQIQCGTRGADLPREARIRAASRFQERRDGSALVRRVPCPRRRRPAAPRRRDSARSARFASAGRSGVHARARDRHSPRRGQGTGAVPHVSRGDGARPRRSRRATRVVARAARRVGRAGAASPRPVRPLVLRRCDPSARPPQDAWMVALATAAPARLPAARAAAPAQTVRDGRPLRAPAPPRRVQTERSTRDAPRGAQRNRLLHLLPRPREGQLLEGFFREGDRPPHAEPSRHSAHRLPAGGADQRDARRGARGRHARRARSRVHRQSDGAGHRPSHLQRLHEGLRLPEAGSGQHPADRDARSHRRAASTVGIRDLEPVDALEPAARRAPAPASLLWRRRVGRGDGSRWLHPRAPPPQ